MSTKNQDYNLKKTNLRDQITQTRDGVIHLLGKVDEYKTHINDKQKKKVQSKMFYQSKMTEAQLKKREKFIMGQPATMNVTDNLGATAFITEPSKEKPELLKRKNQFNFKKNDPLETDLTEQSEEEDELDETDKQLLNLPSLKNQAQRIGQKLDLSKD